MEDLNGLAGPFAKGTLTIEGVYMTKLAPGSYDGHTRSQPTPSAGFVFALRGQAVFVFDDTAYELRPGGGVHGGKRMTLRLEVGPEGFDYVLIHYALTDSSGKPAACSSRHFAWHAAANAGLEERLVALHLASISPGPIQGLRTKELFYGLLFELLTSARKERSGDGAGVAERAMEYIRGHYREPLTLRRLAEQQELEVKRFSYLFHKYTGLFPIDYLIQHRIKWAKHLLVTSGASVSDIAASVGYADAHYFSRLFKKHTGMAPTEFRHGGDHPPDF